VHVRRLVPVMSEEEQPVGPRAKDSGQLRSLAEEVWRRQCTVWRSLTKGVTEWAPAESFERAMHLARNVTIETSVSSSVVSTRSERRS
jgi:hypothetical protein